MANPKGTSFPTDNNNEAIQALRPLTTHTLNFSGTSQATPATNRDTVVVRIYATQNCFLEFGVSPTATNNSMPVPAGVIEFFKVEDLDKIAAIQMSTAGTVYITELR